MLLVSLLSFSVNANAQAPLIHAHNDYEKPEPLLHAMKQKAAFIEADVFPVDGVLYVAHEKNQIERVKTLNGLYIQPIVQLFLNNGGRVSKDSSYNFALCIDIKENPTETLRLLNLLLQPYFQYFDRSKNTYAVQIIISGDRGVQQNWKSYPPYIYFDGRPFEQYSSEELKRIATISDSYKKYADDTALKTMVQKVKTLGKPVRLWGAPDNEDSWKTLLNLGVDIINTDHPERARRFIDQKSGPSTVKRDEEILAYLH